MYLMAAKAGLGFAVVLSILGAIQAQSIAEPLMMFMTIGLIPGTNIEIPAELTLIGVATILMGMTTYIFRRYFAYHAVLDQIMPEFQHEYRDPDYGSLVPVLGRLQLAGRSLLRSANEASIEFYFWLRSLGRPMTAQGVTVRRGFAASLVRLDAWTPAKVNPREKLAAANTLMHEWADKAEAYLVRFTLL